MSREQIIRKIIVYFKENPEVFNEIIEELDSYNGYLEDDRWYPMGFLNEYLADEEPISILQRAFFGYSEPNHNEPFNPNDNYFRFNGYANLVSSYEPDYSDHIDRYTVEEIIENRDFIDDSAITNDETLSSLFDLLDDEDQEEE